MHLTTTVILLLFFGNLFGQVFEYSKWVTEKLQFKENTIYIFCRGTNFKSGLIAHKFNLRDTNITHVGIGFCEEKKLAIYNVSDNSKISGSSLIIDSLESYINSAEVFFLSVWECSNTNEEFKKFKNILSCYKNKKIVFDPFFKINADDTLYCSEWCAMLLNKIDTNKYFFSPSSLVLNNELFESYLGTKILIYFPVDFFEGSRMFKKIFAHRFNQ
jgi:hypothetical protein